MCILDRRDWKQLVGQIYKEEWRKKGVAAVQVFLFYKFGVKNIISESPWALLTVKSTFRERIAFLSKNPKANKQTKVKKLGKGS